MRILVTGAAGYIGSALTKALADRHEVLATDQSAPAAKIDDDPDAHVNLGLWAQGKLKLQPHVVYRVAKRRFGRHFNTLAEVKAHLISERVVDAGSVA